MKTSIGGAKYDASLLKGAGVFIKTVACLIDINLTEEDFDDGRPFMTNFHISGLMTGLQMISDALSERGEYIENLVEKEEAKQEKIALAALARRQSENTLDDTNLRKES